MKKLVLIGLAIFLVVFSIICVIRIPVRTQQVYVEGIVDLSIENFNLDYTDYWIVINEHGFWDVLRGNETAETYFSSETVRILIFPLGTYVIDEYSFPKSYYGIEYPNFSTEMLEKYPPMSNFTYTIPLIPVFHSYNIIGGDLGNIIGYGDWNALPNAKWHRNEMYSGVLAI